MALENILIFLQLCLFLVRKHINSRQCLSYKVEIVTGLDTTIGIVGGIVGVKIDGSQKVRSRRNGIDRCLANSRNRHQSIIYTFRQQPLQRCGAGFRNNTTFNIRAFGRWMIMKEFQYFIYKFHLQKSFCGSKAIYYTIFAARNEPQMQSFMNQVSRNSQQRSSVVIHPNARKFL